MNIYRARGIVSGPAIGLIITAVLGILFHILLLLVAGLQTAGGLLVGTVGAVEGQGWADLFAAIFAGAFSLLFYGLPILVGVFIIYAALKMRSLQSMGLAMTAAVLAMLPCISPFCPLGLIFGIWGLIALSDHGVREAFARRGEEDEF